MNILSKILLWIGNTIGANPNTLTTTSKTLVGAINELDVAVDTANSRIHISTEAPTASDGNNGDIWIQLPSAS